MDKIRKFSITHMSCVFRRSVMQFVKASVKCTCRSSWGMVNFGLEISAGGIGMWRYTSGRH